jgi:Ca-activated chloride channel homolog
MASATQSSSGAAAYLSKLASAMSKTIDPTTLTDLDHDRVRMHVKGLLRGVERSAGSSGWLTSIVKMRAAASASIRCGTMKQRSKKPMIS